MHYIAFNSRQRSAFLYATVVALTTTRPWKQYLLSKQPARLRAKGIFYTARFIVFHLPTSVDSTKHETPTPHSIICKPQLLKVFSRIIITSDLTARFWHRISIHAASSDSYHTATSTIETNSKCFLCRPIQPPFSALDQDFSMYSEYLKKTYLCSTSAPIYNTISQPTRLNILSTSSYCHGSPKPASLTTAQST